MTPVNIDETRIVADQTLKSKTFRSNLVDKNNQFGNSSSFNQPRSAS